MGIVQFLFTDTYRKDYNCSFYKTDKIPLSEKIHFAEGVILMFIGVVFELLYIPVVYALSRPSVRKASFCYEVMLQMCIYDMLTLPITALLTSYFYMTGSMFCDHPWLNLFVGHFLLALWIGYAHVSIILSLNRCLIFSAYGDFLFSEQRRLFWLLYPVGLTIGMLLFASPGIYNGVYGGWFFDPHLSYYTDLTGKYNSQFQFWNNILFCVLIPSIYLAFFIQYRWLAKGRKEKMSKKEYALFVQTLLVKLSITSSAFVYMLMQYIRVPIQVIILTQLAWTVVEGSPALIYLLSNKTIQKVLYVEVKPFRWLRRKITNKPMHFTSAANPSSQGPVGMTRTVGGESMTKF